MLYSLFVLADHIILGPVENLWYSYIHPCTLFFIDLDELVYVNAALAKQANDWLKIGRSLEVSPSSLAIIQANHPAANVGRCLIETLAEWLKNSDLPTWEDVVKAVKKEIQRQPGILQRNRKVIICTVYDYSETSAKAA